MSEPVVEQTFQTLSEPGGKSRGLASRGNGQGKAATMHQSRHKEITKLRVVGDIDQTMLLSGQGGNVGIGGAVVRGHKHHSDSLQMLGVKHRLPPLNSFLLGHGGQPGRNLRTDQAHRSLTGEQRPYTGLSNSATADHQTGLTVELQANG